jgi:hypothetical protein
MNANVIYKKLSELEQGREYKILHYCLNYIESLEKHILNLTFNCDDSVCSVGMPDRIRKKLEAQKELEHIVGKKLQINAKSFINKEGKAITYYDVTFVPSCM